MLATDTSNCAIPNVTYNENEYYVVTWTICLESSMYLRRWWLRHQIVMCHIACCFRSGAVLKFDQLHHSCFLTKPSLDLFPRKCTYAKVIDVRNMVLWSIGFIANRCRISPHQIILCPLLYTSWNFKRLGRRDAPHAMSPKSRVRWCGVGTWAGVPCNLSKAACV